MARSMFESMMTRPISDRPPCPKCGSSNVALCGESLEYSPEEWLGQPLKDRELHTLAYECECGVSFTHTAKTR
jgi:hypothetical protein